MKQLFRLRLLDQHEMVTANSQVARAVHGEYQPEVLTVWSERGKIRTKIQGADMLSVVPSKLGE